MAIYREGANIKINLYFAPLIDRQFLSCFTATDEGRGLCEAIRLRKLPKLSQVAVIYQLRDSGRRGGGGGGVGGGGKGNR